MSDLAGAYAHCSALAREADPDRYYAALLAPAAARPHLLALCAFSVEIARIRDAISSPMPGEIRLQWWRDAIGGEAGGDMAANPVAAALHDTVERHALPRQALLDLIDARTFDLYDDPMPSTAELEGYLGETASALVRLGTLVLAGGVDPGHAAAAGHAGVADGVAALLRTLPSHARQGRLYIPHDVLEPHGVTRDDVVRGRGGPGFIAALADMRALARRHLGAMRVTGAIPRAIRPAFLPVALVPRYLAAMERPGYDALRQPVDVSAWRKIAALWWANRSGL